MIKYLIEKEIKQFVRNSFLPRLVIMMPVAMMLILPWAANQEITNINLSVVDNDHSAFSQRLIQKTAASRYFNLIDYSPTYPVAIESIKKGAADVILELPYGLERNLQKEGFSNVRISVNAVNGTKGAFGSSYLASIINGYADELRKESITGAHLTTNSSVIEVNHQNRFNPGLDYKAFMVPALMVMLLTLICGFLPALNIVSEKETGTMEQINVTPVSKLTFILAKLIPYWVIGFIVLTICFCIAYLVYGLIPKGSVITIYTAALVYIFVVSGFGLVISNYSSTMQQGMFVIFFFMLVFILLSGLFTPVSSMPEWAQTLTTVNPLKYFIQIIRHVYLKGSTITDLLPQIGALFIFAVISNSWAVWSYKKTD